MGVESGPGRSWGGGQCVGLYLGWMSGDGEEGVFLHEGEVQLGRYENCGDGLFSDGWHCQSLE